MAITLSKQMAERIVDTVKDVCGHDINFINTKGIIFASTDPSRIGNFHEIGKKVVESKETIEVSSDNSFYGTHRGVNIPFFYHRELIAVIGISGEPDEVRQFAVLAQKITNLLLREQEMDSVKYGRKNRMNYMIRSIIEGTATDYDQVIGFLEEVGQKKEEEYRVILVQLNARYNPSNLTMIEDQIYQAFDTIHAPLYTFQYPNEYVLLLPTEQYRKWFHVFEKLAEKHQQILSVGVGNAHTLWNQRNSYQEAKTAIASLTGEQSFACFENLDLEILLGCVTDTIKNEYMKKILGKLGKEDRKLLSIYFDKEMSLKDTADTLFLHKNTLQYQLNRIERETGFNPRMFQDAVKLYLALRMEH